MSDIDARELLWRAYTTNKPIFIKKAKTIISYAQNEGAKKQLFSQTLSPSPKNFAFNDQTKQWEYQRNPLNWIIFQNPKDEFAYEKQADAVVVQEIRDRFLKIILETLPGIAEREEKILGEYLNSRTPQALMGLLDNIQNQAFLSFYEKTHARELELNAQKQALEQQRNELPVQHIEQELAKIEQQQQALFHKQLEVYFSAEENEYFGFEIPLERLEAFLAVKIGQAEQLNQKGGPKEEIEAVTQQIAKLQQQITTLKGDIFTPIFKKNSEEPSLLTGDLEPKLFSMINNDAWLINSNFQGGDPFEAASIFLEIIDGISRHKAGPERDSILTPLAEVMRHIQENQQKVSLVTQLGQKSVLVEQQKRSEANAKPKKVQPKSKKTRASRNKMMDFDELSDDDDRPTRSGRPTAEEAKATADEAFTVNAPPLEQQRLEMIQGLARDFQAQIKGMVVGDRVFVPGGFFKHAMLYEFRKEANGKMSFIVYNTGLGLKYHEQKTQFKHGIFKKKHFPAYVYRFSSEKTESSDFQAYLNELLKTNIASSWEEITSDDRVKSVAKKRNQDDLYQHVLPLITHLGGRRVDPKTVVRLPFITGQRSGKCFETILHPIIRLILQNESKYQRLICTYRKETIARFVRAQEGKNQLSGPVVQRQAKRSISKLSKKLYKNSKCFTPYEISSVAKFVTDIKKKLNLAVQVDVVDGFFEPRLALQKRIPEPEAFPSIRARPVNIETGGNQGPIMAESSPAYPEIPLLACEAGDDTQTLIGKLDTVLGLATQLSGDPKIHPREIVSRIEKILLTWPLHQERLEGTKTQDNIKIAESIKALINLYSRQSLLQFGVDANGKLPKLFPQHIVTLLSGLAIIAQVQTGEEETSVKELMKTCGISTLLKKNISNPWLTSTEFSCDSRIRELLQFFDKFPKTPASIKAIYAGLIEKNAEQKTHLLRLYDTLVANTPERYNIPLESLQYLSEVEKCILVLCRCKNEMSAEDTEKISDILRKFDALMNIDNIQAVLGKMLSEGLQYAPTLLGGIGPQTLKFSPKKARDDAYEWNLETPSSEEFRGLELRLSHPIIQRSKQDIQDTTIVKFLENDINHERKDRTSHHQNPFQSSEIQVGPADEKMEPVTEEEFYFKQFCHTRSSTACQIFATINFFQENMALLRQDKWKTVCELNLFQPGLLLDAFLATPNAETTLYAFLKKGLIDNIQNHAPNDAALFFINLQISLNHYLIEANPIYAKSGIESLHELHAQLLEMIDHTQNEVIKRQLYQHQASLLRCLMPYTDDLQKPQLIQNYIKAKLSGEKGSLSAVSQDPLNFMTQEHICFNMKALLIQHPEAVTNACVETLKGLTGSLDIQPLFHYPNVFYTYSESEAPHSIVINLENGQILKDGKTYLPLPKTLLENPQFIDLFGQDVYQAFHSMVQGDREPSVYEIKKDNCDYVIKKTHEGHIFQKNIISEMGEEQRYQLMSYQSLSDLKHSIPKTLMDGDHQFWLSLGASQELLIEDKKTKRAICRVTGLNTRESHIQSTEAPYYKILTQKQTENSLLGKKFSHFENSEFIEIRTLPEASAGLVPDQPLYIITLPRYQLTFHVTNTDPLRIQCINPKGELIFSEKLQELANIQNALFLLKESGERVALLPRQYFIAQDDPSETFEYTPVFLDTQNQHQSVVLKEQHEERTYCQQSEFLEFKLDNNGKLTANESASALYLAYVHLANFDPEAALKILQECEKSGGIKGSQREIEHLMLLFTSLPAQKNFLEDVSPKRIDTPEFIAVKTYALYLYASAKYKQTNLEFEAPSTSDGKCFYQESIEFQNSLQSHIDEFLTKYQGIKNNIPIEMQLTAKQELECLGLSNDPLLILQKERLLLENLKKEKFIARQPHQQQAIRATEDRLLGSPLLESQSQYRTEICDFRITASKDTDRNSLLNLIDLKKKQGQGRGGVVRSTHPISAQDPASFKQQYASKTKIDEAIQHLDLSVDSENFFGFFLTYYHIATSNDPTLEEAKIKLKEFLRCKLKILGNKHPLYGQELILVLYGILEGKLNRLKDPCDFLEEVTEERWRIGYLFSNSKFYGHLIQASQGISISLEVEGIKMDQPSAEPETLEALLSQDKGSPFAQAQMYTAPTLLSYPPGVKILGKYDLSTIEDIANKIHLTPFLIEYQQLSADRASEVSKEKKHLLESSSALNFEDFSSQELAFEKNLGQIHNTISEQQVALAEQNLSDPEQLNALYTEVKDSLNTGHQRRDELLSLIKNIVNQGPLSKADNKLYQLALQGKILQEINEQTLLNLYLLGDEQSFMHKTHLPKNQVAEVYALITEYLFLATHCDQLENINKKLIDLKDVKPHDKPFALRNLANALSAENVVDPAKDPAALSVFQFCGKILLRQEQVDYLRSHVEIKDDKFKDLMSQLIMGFGKTFLLPILAKAKATGNNLSVIEVPDALFETNVADLHSASMRFLNQKTNALRFNRNSPCSAQDLQKLYEWLVGIKQNRDYLVTTGESVASINLRYFETLKSIDAQQSLPLTPEAQATLAELKVQAHYLEKIVKLFKFEADVIVDEVHSNLDVLKKLIYSLGVEGIDQREINIIINLYQFLLPIPVYNGHTIKDIINRPGIIPPGRADIWQNIMEQIAETLVIAPKSPVFNALQDVPNKALIKKYLLNDTLSLPEKIELERAISNLNTVTQDLLALYKAELTRLLPSTLKKENRKHYGLLSEESQLQKQPCAVPFIASDTPHILSRKKDTIRTTQFANPDETINCTIQAYVSEGIPSFMVRSILNKLKDQAKLEFSRDNKTSYDLTETGALFRTLTANLKLKVNEEEISLDLDNFDENNHILETLIAKLQKDEDFIFYALENQILPTIKVEVSTLEHNSNQRAYLYRSIQGIAGTTDTHRSIARMAFDQEKYMGTNGITIDHIIRKRPTVRTLENTDENLVVKLLKHNSDKEHLTHAIIDRGGLFTGVTNFIVAKDIARYLRENKETQRKYILFFNANNQVSAIHIDNPENVIVIGSSDEKVIKKALNNCKEDEWFTYYDQQHTEGTDILQASSATASITFSYDTTLPEFVQAAMRMRGLPNNQRLEVFMEPHIAQSCFNDALSPPIEKAVEFLSNNNITHLSERHLRYTLQEMDNTLYQELLLILLNNPNEADEPEQQLGKARILSIINEHSSLFLKRRVGSLFARYGAIENKDALLKNVLEEKKSLLIALRTQLLEKIAPQDLDASRNKPQIFQERLDQLIETGVKHCKSTVLFRENFDQDAEMEIEAETETESELEADLEVSKVKQEPYRAASEHKIWICNAIDNMRQNPDKIHNLSQNIIPFCHMNQFLESANAYLELDPELYISRNHTQMYLQQHDLFDDHRMPIQVVLMSRHASGFLQSFIITPNEAQELIEGKNYIFSAEGQNPQMWLESSVGVVHAGNRPPEIEKDLKYLKIKEQIKFMNGDMKSLLMQDKYLWLPKYLENKKTLLSAKILTSRPDQIQYTGKLLTRVRKLQNKYEAVAIQLLRGVSAQDAVSDVFQKVDNQEREKIARIAAELLNFQNIASLKQKDPLLSACKLVATFQNYPIDEALLRQLYPEMDPENISCFVYVHQAKKILLQLHKTQESVENTRTRNKTVIIKQKLETLLGKLNPLAPNHEEILKNLLMESVFENDSALTNVIFKIFPEVLNKIQDKEKPHPVLFAMHTHNDLLFVQLLKNHFKEKKTPENSHWIQTAFHDACDHKKLKLLKILIETSVSLELPIDLVEKIIIVLTENAEHELLNLCSHKFISKELESKETQETAAAELDPVTELIKKYQALADVLLQKIPMGKIAERPITWTPPLTEAEVNYVYTQANFTLASSGVSQLMLACLHGHKAAYDQLMAQGANMLQRTNVPPSGYGGNYDVFAYAVSGGNSEIVRDLLLHKKDIMAQLSISSIQGILLQLIANAEKFDGTLVHDIVQALIKDTSFSENIDKIQQEMSLLFQHAIKNKDYRFAEMLTQAAKEAPSPEKINLLCRCPNVLLECIAQNDIQGIQLLVDYNPKLVIRACKVSRSDWGRVSHTEKLPLLEALNVRQEHPPHPEALKYLLEGFLKLSTKEILNNETLIRQLNGIIIDLLRSSRDNHTEIAKRILSSLDSSPTFNAQFLGLFLTRTNAEALHQHLALVKQLSENISSGIVEGQPLLSHFLACLKRSTQGLDVRSEKHETVETKLDDETRMINEIILSLLSVKEEAPQILKYQFDLYDRRGARSTSTLFILLEYISQNPEHQSVLEHIDMPRILETHQYIFGLRSAISEKNTALVSQFIKYARFYAEQLPPEASVSEIFGSFVLTAQEALDKAQPSNEKDALVILKTFFEDPFFSQYISEEQLDNLKKYFLDNHKYNNYMDANLAQNKFDLLIQIFKKHPVQLNDFSEFVKCCGKTDTLQQQQSRDQIFYSFMGNFSVEQLFSSDPYIMQDILRLPPQLFEHIVEKSIEAQQHLNMVEVLKSVIQSGDGHKLQWLLSRGDSGLRLDAEQKESLLDDIVKLPPYTLNTISGDTAMQLLEILNVDALLKDEEKKQQLIPLSIKQNNTWFFETFIR